MWELIAVNFVMWEIFLDRPQQLKVIHFNLRKVQTFLNVYDWWPKLGKYFIGRVAEISKRVIGNRIFNGAGSNPTKPDSFYFIIHIW